LAARVDAIRYRVGRPVQGEEVRDGGTTAAASLLIRINLIGEASYE
jgi:hypothetical protein